MYKAHTAKPFLKVGNIIMNFIGTKTLVTKEISRFLKVYNQTLLIPVVNALLMFSVFSLAMGDRIKNIGDLPFEVFMASGLVMMNVMQHAFANPSSSLIMGKVLGHIVDMLMPPLSALEITLSLTIAGVVRGVLVGVLTACALLIFTPLSIFNIWYMMFFLISGSILLATLGLISGILSESFDQMAAINSYMIVPMSFLSGTFYSINNLPEFWYNISQFNPFFYMIDGFRYGATGYHDSNLAIGMIVMIVANLVAWLTAQTMLNKGYRIKS